MKKKYESLELRSGKMFLCECGGVFLVKKIYAYPSGLTALEKLNYQRNCTVECAECGKIKEYQPFDSEE